jgi:hypothetical protein
MGVSKTVTVLIVLFCYVIVYISLKIIVNYFNPNYLIYLNMYSIYYICFIITLLLALSFNYYINEDNINTIIPAVSTALTIIQQAPDTPSSPPPSAPPLSAPPLDTSSSLVPSPTPLDTSSSLVPSSSSLDTPSSSLDTPSSLVPSSSSLVPSPLDTSSLDTPSSLVPSSSSLVPSPLDTSSLDTPSSLVPSSSSLVPSPLDTSSLNTPSSTEPICRLNEINVEHVKNQLNDINISCGDKKKIQRKNLGYAHPDKNPGCPEKSLKASQEINEIYSDKCNTSQTYL